MTREINDGIIELCTIIDHHGPMHRSRLLEKLPRLSGDDLRRYCTRAIGLRLMSIDREVCPFRYRVLSNWREKIGDKSVKPVQRRVASVWDLGALA
jgi:hypothetical protein